MSTLLKFIAVLPPGLELEGTIELISLGAKNVKPLRRAVRATTDLPGLYRIYLQSRLPFRLFRELATFTCDGPKDLYSKMQEVVDWKYWLHPSQSFRVSVTGSSKGLNHTHYTALQVKDSIVNMQERIWGRRSTVNLQNPDLCLHLHLDTDKCTLSLDGSFNSLHHRGWRSSIGIAPMKENLAAGLIQITGWDGSVSLVDPLCGSGTLLIEAARRVLGKVPGLERQFILKNWADFDSYVWAQEKAKAFSQECNSEMKSIIAPIIGIEKDKSILAHAQSNAKAAGVSSLIEFRYGNFQDLMPCTGPGIIITNPPYGVRLNSDKGLEKLYSDIGYKMKEYCKGWEMWSLSGNSLLTGYFHMKSRRRYCVSNGGIDCRWLNYEVH
uniref:Putative RNA methylase family protein n=1 Tax=Paulinella chromatophora TaxID=39717 RepID=B1X576_PAUCH|nr:Putative RNA methylase family protein [Paulinella chromatophora]ACB43095.1 Putative RNA methylase family protein [Paulinella chromatophora]